MTLASGKQYELLKDHIGDALANPSYVCEVILGSNSGRGPQDFSLKFSLPMATEDPREWHYYVFFLVQDRRTKAEGISPPMATKKRLQKPIEQGKWKSTIELLGLSSLYVSCRINFTPIDIFMHKRYLLFHLHSSKRHFL